MWLSVLYVFSFLTFYMSLCAYPKVQRRIPLLNVMLISYITQLCIGALVAEIFSLLKIAINIQSMGVIWLILGVIIWTIIIYKKEIQKISIELPNLFGVIVLTIFIIYLFYKIFTPDFYWVYTTTDPSSHYIMAQNVMRTGRIDAMYFTALYNSLLMEVVRPFVTEISLYKVFIISDTVLNYVNLLMCYMWMCSVCKHKKMKWIIPLFCILYFLGWPLSSYAYYGFVYFGMGVTLCAYVLYLIYIADIEELHLNKRVLYSLAIVGTFGVTVCYMLFTPVLIWMIFLYLIITKRQHISTKVIVKILPALIVLLTVAFCIAFFGYFHGDISNIFASLLLDGGIQKHLFEDFVFIMPFVIYMLIKGWKDKHIVNISMIALMFVIVVGFIMVCTGLMGGYYYYKLYYPLWFLCWILYMMAFEKIYIENKVLLISITIPFLSAFLIMWTGTEDKLPSVLGSESAGGLFPIYQCNRQLLYHPDEYTINDRKAVENLTRFIKDTFDKEEKIPVIYGHRAYHLGKEWYQALSGCESYDYDNDNLEQILNEILNQYDYFAISAGAVEGNENLLKHYHEVYNEGDYMLYAVRGK